MFLHLMSLNMHHMWCRGCLSCTILKSISLWRNGLWWLVLSLASLPSVCPTCICCASGPPSAVFWSSFSVSSPSQYHAMMVCFFPGPHKSTTAVLNFVSFKLLHASEGLHSMVGANCHCCCKSMCLDKLIARLLHLAGLAETTCAPCALIAVLAALLLNFV